MKVGFLTPSISIEAGGMATAIHALGLAIRACGIEVTIFTAEGENGAERDRAWRRLPIMAVPIRGPRSYGFMPALSAALDHMNPDLLHVHGIWMYTTSAACRWAERNGKPFMISPHGMLDAWALRNRWWKKRAALSLYEHRNLRRSNCLHALTHAELMDFRRQCLGNPVAIIPNGVTPPSRDTATIPPEWAAMDSRKVLLFLGRLHAQKGLTELVAAWGRLKREQPRLLKRWVLVIAGWDHHGYEAVLRRSVQEWNIKDDVRFLGAVQGETKDRLLRHADAMILPSYGEGMPMSILEAWSYGLPVFMSAACNLPEGFTAGAAIEIAADPLNIAGALSRTLHDEPALQRMGARGLTLVSDRFSWPTVASQMTSVYGWLVEGGTRPAFVNGQ